MDPTHTAAATVTRDPRRLAALCELWLQDRRELRLTLNGWSMSPTLPPGTRLRLLCAREGLEVGSVIAVRRAGQLVIHRLVEITDPGDGLGPRYICKGDHNAYRDEPALESEVVGVVRDYRVPSAAAAATRRAALATRSAAVRVLRRFWDGPSGPQRARPLGDRFTVEAAGRPLARHLRLSPEAEMVLCLASLRPAAGEQERARRLAPGLNWERFLQLALESGLSGLIGRSLAALGEAAPPQVREALDQAARRCRRRNAVLYNFLGETLAALTEFGVPHLVLKGAALVETVYEDAGLREMADVDILLPRGRRKEALAYLGKRGLDREDRGIDTQWLLTDRGIRWTQIPVEEIWSTARPAEIAGQPTLVMSPEYQLLHLCLHGDAFVSLKWLCDVREVLRAHPELHWPAFCRLALTDGVVRRHVYRKLCLAEEILNAPVPTEVLRHVDPGGARGALIRRLARRWNLGGERIGQARLNRAPEVFLLESVAMGDLSQLRHALRLVFRPDPRWAAARYREAGARPAHSASMARAAARALARAAGAFLRR